MIIKHNPNRGPWLVNGNGGQPVNIKRTIVRSRTKAQPEITETDPKTKKVTRIPRRVPHHTITPA